MQMENVVGFETLGSTLKVKRYPNRKMTAEGLKVKMGTPEKPYLTTYITLEHIESAIKQGKRMQAFSFPDGKDVTSNILRSILQKNLTLTLGTLSEQQLQEKVVAGLGD